MDQTTTPPRAVKPAAAKPAGPARKRPAQPVQAEWISRLGDSGVGIALIGRGSDLAPYRVTEITGPLGDETVLMGYRLEKADGATVYDIDLLAEYGPTCECMGHLRWGRPCKHLVGLQILTGAVWPEERKPGPPAETAGVAGGYPQGCGDETPF